MEGLFQSARIRISRARELKDEIDRDTNLFFATQTYEYIKKKNIESGNYEHRAVLKQRFPDRLSAISADAVGNLRSALDQAGYASAVASGKENPKHCHFPFAEKLSDLENSIKGRCKDIPVSVLNLMRSFQPYSGGNDLLWAMNDSRRVNEHAFISMVATVISDASLGPTVILRSTGFAMIRPVWDRQHNEILYAVARPGTIATSKPRFKFNIVFSRPDAFAGELVVPTLEKLIHLTETIVASIEEECGRINLSSK
ncbi:hypothetical protein [Methylobrevis albus]|uniref:Uncharacterized protein n=1 Tax=Methylobrevis albus TaxID=2793297 RepID=A0A931I3Z1_9HYPH|nr:hypothetical protein [Methylobrevis albus]MBH0239442.1 hypothetical protein [Methylobrevis albus]